MSTERTTIPQAGTVKCMARAYSHAKRAIVSCENMASYYHARYPHEYVCGGHLRACPERIELPQASEGEIRERNADAIREAEKEAQEAREGATLHITIPRIRNIRVAHGIARERGFINVLPNIRSGNSWASIVSRIATKSEQDCDFVFRCDELAIENVFASAKCIEPVHVTRSKTTIEAITASNRARYRSLVEEEHCGVIYSLISLVLAGFKLSICCFNAPSLDFANGEEARYAIANRTDFGQSNASVILEIILDKLGSLIK